MSNELLSKVSSWLSSLLRERGTIRNLQDNLSVHGAHDGILVARISSGDVVLCIPDKSQSRTRRFLVHVTELPP